MVSRRARHIQHQQPQRHCPKSVVWSTGLQLVTAVSNIVQLSQTMCTSACKFKQQSFNWSDRMHCLIGITVASIKKNCDAVFSAVPGVGVKRLRCCGRQAMFINVFLDEHCQLDDVIKVTFFNLRRYSTRFYLYYGSTQIVLHTNFN